MIILLTLIVSSFAAQINIIVENVPESRSEKILATIECLRRNNLTPQIKASSNYPYVIFRHENQFYVQNQIKKEPFSLKNTEQACNYLLAKDPARNLDLMIPKLNTFSTNTNAQDSEALSSQNKGIQKNFFERNWLPIGITTAIATGLTVFFLHRKPNKKIIHY